MKKFVVCIKELIIFFGAVNASKAFTARSLFWQI